MWPSRHAGVFATLVIQLPAEHKGGELVVQHNGEEKVFDFAPKSAAKIFFAAFLLTAGTSYVS